MPTTETEAAPPSVQTIRAADLVETPPEPSAHVVKNATPETAPPAATTQPAPAAAPQPAPGPVLPPKTDRRGTPFDPERHLDRLHPKSGAWMPKKPKKTPLVSTVGSARQPAKSVVAPDDSGAVRDAGNGVAGPAGDGPAIEVPTDQFKVAALGACTVLYAAGMTLGGDEWRPSDDEHANLSMSFEAYFKAKGITDLSPGWALAIALVAYAGPRFRQPKTLSTLQKIGGFFQRVGAWWKSRSVRKSIPTQ